MTLTLLWPLSCISLKTCPQLSGYAVISIFGDEFCF